ncbi:MAG TPA: FecR domain-containing protein [Steroidobacteraceae bacterium]|jgi:transmembrane sensor
MRRGNDPKGFIDRDAEHAARGAAHWLAVLSDEHCTEAERREFFEWLRSSTRNVDEFLRLSTLVRSASNPEVWPNESIESLVAAARNSSNVTELQRADEQEPGRSPRRFIPWALAASLVGILVLGAALLTQAPMTSWLETTYTTRIGEQRSITLEDGSLVQLNSRSQLRTQFTDSVRAVELDEGEAIFRVARDPSRPFRVRTRAMEIVALGTAFNVNADEMRTVVTVLEGRIKVQNRIEVPQNVASPTPREFELAVGEQLIVSPTHPVVRVSLADVEKVTSWTERRLIFENTPLADAAREFARYSPREIRIEDPQIAARQISGVFDATDPASLVEFLKQDATAEVLPHEDGWVVRSRR